MFRKAVKKLVIEKKLNIWNEVVERANSDFEGCKKEFWAFISKKTKGRRKGISSSRNKAEVSVCSLYHGHMMIVCLIAKYN